MDAAQHMQALRVAVSIVDTIQLVVANNIELTATLLNDITTTFLNDIKDIVDNCANIVLSLSSEEMDYFTSQVELIVGPSSPLWKAKSNLSWIYGTGLKTYIEENVNLKDMESSFLPTLTKKTHKVFLSIPPSKLHARYHIYNIPVHAGNFVMGLVAPSVIKEKRVFKLIDEYLNSKRWRAKQIYDARPDVAPLRELINKFSETATSIINVMDQAIQLKGN
jgi:hypothetical protein